MRTSRAIRTIQKRRDRSRRELQTCHVEDIPAIAAHVARCNVALRKLALRAVRCLTGRLVDQRAQLGDEGL